MTLAHAVARRTAQASFEAPANSSNLVVRASSEPIPVYPIGTTWDRD